MLISQYIAEKIEDGSTPKELSKFLGVKTATISLYKQDKTLPRLKVAKLIYKADKLIIHPYSEEAILIEIQKEIK